MSEGQLQRDVAKLLKTLGWLALHCPNGASLRGGNRAWNSLKAQGALKGVSDWLILEDWEAGECKTKSRDCGYLCDCGCSGHGIAIELKWGKGVASDEQKAFLAAAEERGWLTAVCWTYEEVLDVLRKVRPLNGGRLV